MDENVASGPVLVPPAGGGQSRSAAAVRDVSSLELSERAAQYQADLAAEIRPQSTLARILVAQLGRHAAGLDLAAASEAATVRFASVDSDAAQLFASADPADRPFLAAMSSGLVATASRYQSRHQRAFFAALRELREVSRQQAATPAPQLFHDEESCVAYLAKWQQDQPWQCPACGGQERYFLPSRAVIECECGRQMSIREGTVAAGSKLPLLAWFQVMVSLIFNAQLPTSELAQAVRVVRRGTLRKMRTKIRAAMASPDAEQRLAGLPTFVADHLRQVSQASRAGSRQIASRRGRAAAAINIDHEET